jgi:hypothetical protein
MESYLFLTAAAGNAKPVKIDGDGEAEQEATCCVEPIPLHLAGGVNELPEQQADDQRNVAEGHEATGFFIEESIWDAHWRNSFRD